MSLNIAIDGPVGAGKSTIAKAVAKQLDILYLDTGAMYRALGLKALQLGLDPNDENAMSQLCKDTTIGVAYQAGSQHTYLDKVDVSQAIRKPEVSMAASNVSKHGNVRGHMVALQQALAVKQDAVLDGRDIGTRVLPNATIKIFLTATPHARAMRRYLELKEKGAMDTFEEVLADLNSRDHQDMNRAVDPLRAASDAVIVDTTELNFGQSVAAILSIVKEGNKA